jgi:hypothetical protein
VLNALGATGSGLALLALLVTKFTHGGWVVVLFVTLGVLVSVGIHRHYQRADAWLARPDAGRADWTGTRVVIALSRPDEALEAAGLGYAQRLRPAEGPDVTVVDGRRAVGEAIDDIGRPTSGGLLTFLVVPVWSGEPPSPAWSPRPTLLRRVRRLDHVAVTTLVVDPDRTEPDGRHACLVAVDGADALAGRGLAVARMLRPDELHAIHVEGDGEDAARAVSTWQSADLGVDLRILGAPYRERGGPLRDEVRDLQRCGAGIVSAVLCTLRPRWWQRPLYRADTAAVRRALTTVPGAALVEHRVPFPRRWDGDGGRRPGADAEDHIIAGWRGSTEQ